MSIPLHRRIRRDIEARIMAGTLKPGDRVPFEHELMREYSCSRMTVNKALSALAAGGLINRQRGSGSVVVQPGFHMAVLTIPDIRDEIVKRSLPYRLELLSRKVTREAGIEGDVLSLCCRHFADGKVFAVEERQISLLAVPEAANTDFSEAPPGSWLLAHVPWTSAEHRIAAAPAGALAGLLEIPSHTACLVLERTTWREGRLITHVRQTSPGECLDLSASFAPASG